MSDCQPLSTEDTTPSEKPTPVDQPLSTEPDKQTEKMADTESTDKPGSNNINTVQYTDADVERYRSIAINFIQKNRNNIGQIYINHFKEVGLGIIFIDITQIDTSQKIDVAFVKFEALDLELANKIAERSLNNTNDIMYMYMITPCEQKIVEMDIRDLISRN